ncbi:MAG: Hypothetical protein AJITA_00393 [Acetilactobacillus jinshanensis]
MTTAIIYFVVSLIFNSAGNVLTLVSSAKIHVKILGSAYWTAAENNFGVAFHWPLFWAFLGLGLLTTLLNFILIGHWSWSRLIGNLIFLIPFSSLIQFFDGVFSKFFPQTSSILGTIIYILVNFLGVTFIAVAISIYQRVNLALHPADDLMQILRFKFFDGNAAKAMWCSYIPPTLIAISAIVMSGVMQGSLFVALLTLG